MPSPESPFILLRTTGSRRLFWLGLPLLLYAWTITGDFAFDDLHLVNKAERYLRGESNFPGLFRFAGTPAEWEELRNRGTAPWWAPVQLQIALFRPLAEWSFILDMKIFGRNPVGHHLISLAWFAVVLYGVNRLYRQAGQDEQQAGLATLFFGISQTLAQPVTFICNRSDLMVLVGTTIAATAYWSRTNRRTLWPIGLAAGGYAFALLSKEMALGLAGAVLAYEFMKRVGRRYGVEACRDTTSPQDESASTNERRRKVIALILTILAIAYVAYYVHSRPWHLGSAAGETANNLSPLSNAPLAFPLYLAVWLLGFPINLLLAFGKTASIVVASLALIAITIIARYLYQLVRRDGAALFFLLWAVSFAGVGLLTRPEPRVLSVATVGWAYLLSGLLIGNRAIPNVPPRWIRHWLLAANGAISICCAVGIVLTQNYFEHQSRRLLTERLAQLTPPLRDGEHLFVGEAQSELELLFPADRLEFLTGYRHCAITFLTLPGTGAAIEPLDGQTLRVRKNGGDLLGAPSQRFLLGSGWSPTLGQTFELADFTATIRQIDNSDRVTAIDFRFRQPISDPRHRFTLNQPIRQP